MRVTVDIRNNGRTARTETMIFCREREREREREDFVPLLQGGRTSETSLGVSTLFCPNFWRHTRLWPKKSDVLTRIIKITLSTIYQTVQVQDAQLQLWIGIVDAESQETEFLKRI